MIIREEKLSDFNEIDQLIKSAFKTAEVADGDEQDYVRQLRGQDVYIPKLALVSELDEKIAGHIILCRFNYSQTSLLVACLAVAPAFHGKGVGSKLMNAALKKGKVLGFSSVFLAGYPDYYQRFGFRPTKEYNIINTNGIPEECAMALALTTGGLKQSGTITF